MHQAPKNHQTVVHIELRGYYCLLYSEASTMIRQASSNYKFSQISLVFSYKLIITDDKHFMITKYIPSDVQSIFK